MNKSEAVNELFASLATAQGQMENPKRNKTVNVMTKSGRSYQFSYADFAAVTNAVRGPLSANGLSYTQTLEPDPQSKFRLHTTLWHSSGQFIQSETPLLVEEPTSQSFGSALTFMKRYALCALLGIAADDDDDANAADGNTATQIVKGKPKVGLNVMKIVEKQSGAPVSAPSASEHQPAPPTSSNNAQTLNEGGEEAPDETDSERLTRLVRELTHAKDTGGLRALAAKWKTIHPSDQHVLEETKEDLKLEAHR